MEDLDYTTKNFATNKSPQNVTGSLFNKGNAFNFTRIQRNTPSPGEGLNRNILTKSRGSILVTTANQNLATNNGPIKPPNPNDKNNNNFVRFGSTYSSNSRPIYGEPSETTDSKAKHHQSTVGQIASQIMYTSKTTNDNSHGMHQYEEKKQFKDRYNHNPIDHHKQARESMADSKITMMEKSTAQVEKQSEIVNDRIMVPRPSSRTIVRDVMAAKDNGNHTESTITSHQSTFRITTTHTAQNFSETGKTSQISTADTSSKKSSIYPSNDVEYDSKSSKIMISEEPHGLVGLKNIGNTCFM